jgi:hypothetical protein
MLWRAPLFLVLFLTFASPCLAQSETGGATPEASAGDADATAPLKRMHAYLTSTPEVEFETSFSSTSDLPGMNKRGTAHFLIRQPNQFRVESSSNGGTYLFISDGTTFTLYSPAKGKFAQTRARGSIIGTMYLAVGLLNLHARFIDFLWTLDYGENVKVAAGGAETIGNRQCDRFSVDRFENDWEVWLEQTGIPLPCKLVSRTMDGGTVQTNEFVWKANPDFSPDAFAFSPPKGSREVDVSDFE